MWRRYYKKGLGFNGAYLKKDNKIIRDGFVLLLGLHKGEKRFGIERSQPQINLKKQPSPHPLPGQLALIIFTSGILSFILCQLVSHKIKLICW